MYTPPAYREDDIGVLHDLMREWSFATLFSHGPEGGLMATHLPFLVASGGEAGLGLLTSHIARNNPHWQQLQTASEVLVVFQGPHGYVPVDWYTQKQTFPTWNYGAVHAYGRITLERDAEAIHAILKRTIATFNEPREGGWRFEEMPASAVEPRLRAIIGLDIEITRLEGKLKFNQDKTEADRQGVRRGLSLRPGTQETARFMERLESRITGSKMG